MSRSRPSPSRDRPVATHNAAEPAPRPSVRDIGGLGEVCGSATTRSTRTPGIVNRNGCRNARVHGEELRLDGLVILSRPAAVCGGELAVAPSITPRLIELERLAGPSVPRFATPHLGCGLASRTSSGAEDRDGCAPSSSHTARSTRMALLSRSKLAPSCRSVPTRGTGGREKKKDVRRAIRSGGIFLASASSRLTHEITTRAENVRFPGGLRPTGRMSPRNRPRSSNQLVKTAVTPVVYVWTLIDPPQEQLTPQEQLIVFQMSRREERV